MTALDSMVRVHRWVVDEKRRKLADLQTFVDKLKDDLIKLDEELETEREGAGRSDEAGLTYPAFVAAALERRSKLCETIANLEKEIEETREDVAESFRELKKFEMARTNQESQESAKQSRRDRLALDELGISIYRRNRAGND
jgi:flagellar FliJ protein